MLIKFVATLVIIASFVRSFAQSRPASGLRLISENRLEINNGVNGWAAANVLPDSVVFPQVVVLRCRFEGERGQRSTVLFADQMPSDDFRRLRLWLRWCQEAKAGVSHEA